MRERLTASGKGAYLPALVEASMRRAKLLTPLLLAICAAGCGGGKSGPLGEGRAAGASSPTSRPPEQERAAGGVRRSRRTLLIGLDAADEQMILPLVQSGRLPALARFYREGVTGPLRSHRPMLSPILWTSIATGVSPEQHGVLDFIQFDEAGRASPIGSRARRAAAFWEILGSAGVKVAVVGWLASFPATPVNGYLVSDRFTIHPFETPDSEPSLDPAGKTYPPGLIDEIAPLAVRPEQISTDDLQRDFGVPPASSWSSARTEGAKGAARGRPQSSPGDADERALRVVLSTTRSYAAVAERLLREKAPELTAVYFDGVDRLLHIFADVASPPLKGSDPRRAVRYGSVGEHFYSAIDRTVGELAQAAGPDVTIIVVSDHGWKTGPERPARDPRRDGPFAADWHRDRGILFARGSGIRGHARCERADLYDVAPTLLALYGMAPGDGFKGKVLEEIFEPGFLPPRPPAAGAYPAPVRAAGPAGVSPAGGERAAVENLRSLGYIAGGAAGSPEAGGGPAGDRSKVNLATVYLEEGKYQKATALYQEFLKNHARDYDAFYNLGFSMKEAGDQDGARAALREAARIRPALAEPWMTLGEIEARQRNWPKALEAFERARALEPGDANVWNHFGAAACETGKVDEGIRAFQRAIELNPRLVSAYLNLSRVLDGTGRKDEAVELIRKGFSQVPEDQRLSRRLSELGAGPSAR